MIGPDGLDDYEGDYDAEADRVQQAATQAVMSAASEQLHRDMPRPWWCAHCHSEALTESDRLYGVCSGCAERDRRARERCRSNAELGLGAPPARSGRRAS